MQDVIANKDENKIVAAAFFIIVFTVIEIISINQSRYNPQPVSLLPFSFFGRSLLSYFKVISSLLLVNRSKTPYYLVKNMQFVINKKA